MSRTQSGSVVRFLAVVLGVGLCAAWGPGPGPQAAPHDEPAKGGAPTGKTAPKGKRTAYFLKHGSAKGLAAVLGKYFQGEVEVQAPTDGPGNCLLLSGPPSALAEAVKLLERLDRPPQTVAVEVLLAEAVPAKEGDGPDDKALDEKEFTGPAAEVLAKATALQKKGLLGSLKRVRLVAAEGRPTSVQVSEMVPQLTRSALTGTGRSQYSFSYRNVGTSVEVTPRVSGTKVVQLDLNVQASAMRMPPDKKVAGKDEQGNPPEVVAPVFTQKHVKTSLSIPSGRAVAAVGEKATAKAGETRMLVIVTARVTDFEDKGDK